jgi:hypothetical protein
MLLVLALPYIANTEHDMTYNERANIYRRFIKHLSRWKLQPLIDCNQCYQRTGM